MWVKNINHILTLLFQIPTIFVLYILKYLRVEKGGLKLLSENCECRNKPKTNENGSFCHRVHGFLLTKNKLEQFFFNCIYVSLNYTFMFLEILSNPEKPDHECLRSFLFSLSCFTVTIVPARMWATVGHRARECACFLLC